MGTFERRVLLSHVLSHVCFAELSLQQCNMKQMSTMEYSRSRDMFSDNHNHENETHNDQQQSAEQELRKLLLKGSLRMADHISRMDREQKGFASRADFIRDITKCGMRATPEEISALYDTIRQGKEGNQNVGVQQVQHAALNLMLLAASQPIHQVCLSQCWFMLCIAQLSAWLWRGSPRKKSCVNDRTHRSNHTIPDRALKMGLRPSQPTFDPPAQKPARAEFSRARARCPPKSVNSFDFENSSFGSEPFFQQGDSRFESPRAVWCRMKLLESGRIATACRQFWDTLGLEDGDAVHEKQYRMVRPGPRPSAIA